MSEILSLFNSVRGIVIIILFLGGSIFVHELGHFLAAKWRGLKVERFSIGFGPRVFGWRGKDGVDYRISLLPLGGYVALPQLADMEVVEGKSESESESLAEISYTSKLIVFAAGAFFNILFALLCALILWGIKVPTTEGLSSNVIGYVEKELTVSPGKVVENPAYLAGLLPGDKILEVDGKRTDSFDKISQAIVLGSGRNEQGRAHVDLRVLRASGVEEVLQLEPILVSHNPRSGDYVRTLGLLPIEGLTLMPLDGFPAARAGVLLGDKLLACDTGDGKGFQKLYSLAQLTDLLREQNSQKVKLEILREGERHEIDMPVEHVLYKQELLAFKFKDGNAEYLLKLILTPENLEDFSGETPRKTLRVLESLPKECSLADLLVPGAVVDAFSVLDSGIKSAKSYSDFDGIKAGMMPTFFVTAPNGESRNFSVEIVSKESIPAKTRPLIGVKLLAKTHLVRKNPIEQFSNVIDLMIASIGGLINPKSDIGVGHLNSVITISETYYQISYNLRSVLSLTVLLNINLAFLNLLPIPILDGGHILIATIQRLRRRKISQGIINGVQYVFLLILLSFMGFILVKDFSRFLGNGDLKAAALVARHQYVRETLPPLTGGEPSSANNEKKTSSSPKKD